MTGKPGYLQQSIKDYFLFFLIFLLTLLFGLSCLKPRVYQIGVLAGMNIPEDITASFLKRMNELGYNEGKNIVFDVQKTDFSMSEYTRILKDFIKHDVDLIFVYPTEAAMQAKELTQGTDIPIVFANAYTEDTGLVASIQKPGGNITGVRWPGPEIALKSFQVMQELVPKLKRVFVPYQKNYPIVRSQLEILKSGALAQGVNVIEIPASDARELESELKKLRGPFDNDVIQMIAEPLFTTDESVRVLFQFANEKRMLIGGAPIFRGDFQSIFALTPDMPLQGQLAANIVDKIFKGTPAGEILVSTAPYQFHFNYGHAQKIGLTVKEELLNQVDNIIK